jgi:hypothetical protein
LPDAPAFNTPALLEAFFERSQDGFFFMMIDRILEKMAVATNADLVRYAARYGLIA